MPDSAIRTKALGPPGPQVTAVIVTRDRPALLRACLASLEAQARRPDRVLVVDNASGPETAGVLDAFPGIRVLRQARNLGAAAGYCAGIEAALRAGADWVWLMDDDGRPRDPLCLGTLLRAADRAGAQLAAPLVLDVDAPQRLAFPLRLAGHTCFEASEVLGRGDLAGFAHLFNGALIASRLFFRIGLPDCRFVIRGDEVEFLYRARAAGARIVLATETQFLHPGSAPEIQPILAGLYYATMPPDAVKRFYQFRNRAWIFRRYRRWGWLAADVLRYGCFYLGTRRDPRGYGHWLGATWTGLRGDFMREPWADGVAPAPARAAPSLIRRSGQALW